MNKPMLVLIAGPYRSGTDGDPDRIAANLRRLESAAWPIHHKGHIPMIGEWVALPVLRGAADQPAPAEAPEGDVMYDVAGRLLQHCDAVLRLSGESHGADRDVEIAEARGLPIYYDAADIPDYVQR
ncbi:DUF4406 domain-containing protein [Kribbella sp. ALI-6-A]|uniref:DUF4406 domain-containing protein n=1 Tax=Kribbella sp. ALI-6-A TaxID=1933817 RepID=UPI001EDC4600|nr:DUF4406 domain-containing protein [Kribbella sp. ALI-6-A]